MGMNHLWQEWQTLCCSIYWQLIKSKIVKPEIYTIIRFSLLLTLTKQALVFTCLQYKSFENIVGKGEIACNKNFSFSPSVFYPLGELSAIFNKFKMSANSFRLEESNIVCLGKN